MTLETRVAALEGLVRSLITRTGSSSSAVSSVFGRTGDVTATSGDYSEAQITFTDVTTNDVSTSKHGYVPKGTNTGKFLKDDGSWAMPASSGALAFVTSAAPSSASSFTLNVTGYYGYMVTFWGTPTNQTVLTLNCNSDTGSNYDYSYFGRDTGSTAGSDAAGQTASRIAITTANEATCFILYIFKKDASSRGNWQCFSGHGGGGASEYGNTYIAGGNWSNTSNALSSITITAGAGTLTGVAYVYGMASS